MKQTTLCAALALWVAPVSAAPEAPPPDGYAGAQFVDSQGCAFSRATLGEQVIWADVLDASGQPLCGMEPTVVVEGGSDMLPEIAVTRRNRAPTFPEPGTYLQVGAFGLTANADRVTGDLQAAGLSVLRQDFPRNRGQLRVLFVGPFLSDAQIAEAFRIVREQGFRDAFSYVQTPLETD